MWLERVVMAVIAVHVVLEKARSRLKLRPCG